MTKEKSASDTDALVERPARPRDRIFACAQDLFHRRGIRGVGVEAIAEAAGTSKMALYRHFDSKDELIIEYLNYKGRKSDEVWAEIEAVNPGDPVGQLYGFMETLARLIADDERGCDLANAAIELTEAGHPGLRLIEEFKMGQRDRLSRLCRAAGASQPDLLADTLFLLIEGARVSRRSVGTKGPSANLLRTSRGVIASFGVRSPATRHSRLKSAKVNAK
jgi:AcrR family transcriptional regulator